MARKPKPNRPPEPKVTKVTYVGEVPYSIFRDRFGWYVAGYVSVPGQTAFHIDAFSAMSRRDGIMALVEAMQKRLFTGTLTLKAETDTTQERRAWA